MSHRTSQSSMGFNKLSMSLDLFHPCPVLTTTSTETGFLMLGLGILDCSAARSQQDSHSLYFADFTILPLDTLQIVFTDGGTGRVS